ncbi:LexA family protein [Crassaminicella profunda]|uniref:LexA family protein n=1 Tax=Crassaminicella profunda TaxID=1286698 RepID=UPI001CA6CEC4|nr:S24 family peptidase [Crassaminicella profunda]QZY55847.1 S24 family peptidase [Crassaminicella profunda]
MCDLPFSKDIKIPIIRVNIYERSKDGVILPVVSYSAAGSPLSTQERFEENIVVPKRYAKGKNVIAVKIRGDSMKDIGIDDESVVLVKTSSNFKSGIIGIVTLGDQYDFGTTCKKIVYEKGNYRLISLNSEKNYDDFFVKEGQLRYVGEVVGIYEVETD